MNISSLTSIIPKESNDIIGLMIMKKAMDTAAQDGQNMAALLAQALPHPYLGQTVDIKA